jgi:hypothetical protein
VYHALNSAALEAVRGSAPSSGARRKRREDVVSEDPEEVPRNISNSSSGQESAETDSGSESAAQLMCVRAHSLLCTCSVTGASAEHSTGLLIDVAKHYDHVHNALQSLIAGCMGSAGGAVVAWGTLNTSKGLE